MADQIFEFLIEPSWVTFHDMEAPFGRIQLALYQETIYQLCNHMVGPEMFRKIQPITLEEMNYSCKHLCANLVPFFSAIGKEI